MTEYAYVPTTGLCVNIDNGADTVPISSLGPGDTLDIGNPPAGSPQVPFTVDIPPGSSLYRIKVDSELATVNITGALQLDFNCIVSSGTLNVGSSGTETTVAGSVGAAGSGHINFSGTVTISPNVHSYGLAAFGPGLVTLMPGANVTVNGLGVGPDGPKGIVLGNGSTLEVTGALTGASANQLFNSVLTASGATAKLLMGAIDNTGNTLDFTGDPNLVVEPTSITGGTVVTAASTQLYGETLSNIQIVGVINGPSSSSPYPIATLVNVTGIGIIVVPGSVTLEGSQDPLTYNLFEGSIFSPSALTFAPGSVIDLVTGTFGFGDTTFLGQTTLQGRLDVSVQGQAQNYTIFEYAPLLFAAGSSVEIDKNAFLEINGVNSTTGSLDNETTIQLAGGTLQLDAAPATLGTIQFYTGNSTLMAGNAAVFVGATTESTTFALSGTLSDFSDSDAVIFNGAAYGANATATLTGNTLSVVDQNGTTYGTFTLTRDDAETYVQNDFTLAAVTGGMELITNGVSVLAAPVVTGDTFFQVHNFFAPGPAVLADPSVTVSDPGSTTLASATVAITSSFASGDTLGFANQSGITGAYNAAAGVLSLTGTATVSQYQQAFDSVTYGFTPGGDPTLGGGLTTRTLSWSVNDGQVMSLPAMTTITENFTAPVLNFTGTVTYDALQAPVVIDAAVTLTDPNNTTLTGATVSISDGAASDLLTAVTAGTSITAAYDGTAQVLTLSGTDTIANYVSVLDSAAFSSTAADPSSGGDTPDRAFTVNVTDAGGNTATSTAFATVTCFARGTRIATENGEAGVETLRPGDRVWTREGVLAPIVWVGRRRIDCRRHPDPAAVQPIRIRAHAFGEGAPRRDLFLSPDHAIFLEGVLVPIKHLVDGARIARAPVTEVEYFHIELPDHEVILAEGLEVESYLNTGEDKLFGRDGQAIELFPALSCRGAGDVWQTSGRAPLVVTGPKLTELRRRVRYPDRPRIAMARGV